MGDCEQIDVLGYVEVIEHKEDCDTLHISNQPHAWGDPFFSSMYKDFGEFSVKKPHIYKDKQFVLVSLEIAVNRYHRIMWRDYNILDVRNLGDINDIGE